MKSLCLKRTFLMQYWVFLMVKIDIHTLFKSDYNLQGISMFRKLFCSWISCFSPQSSVVVQSSSIRDQRLHLFLGAAIAQWKLGQNFTSLLRRKLESGRLRSFKLSVEAFCREMNLFLCTLQATTQFTFSPSGCNFLRAGALVISISMLLLTCSTRGIK